MPAGSGVGAGVGDHRGQGQGDAATRQPALRSGSMAAGAASVQVTFTVNGPAVETFPARSSASTHRVYCPGVSAGRSNHHVAPARAASDARDVGVRRLHTCRHRHVRPTVADSAVQDGLRAAERHLCPDLVRLQQGRHVVEHHRQLQRLRHAVAQAIGCPNCQGLGHVVQCPIRRDPLRPTAGAGASGRSRPLPRSSRRRGRRSPSLPAALSSVSPSSRRALPRTSRPA